MHYETLRNREASQTSDRSMYAYIGDRATLILAMKHIESDMSRREGAYSRGMVF